MAALQIRLGTVTPHGSVSGELSVLAGSESFISTFSIRAVSAPQTEQLFSVNESERGGGRCLFFAETARGTGASDRMGWR